MTSREALRILDLADIWARRTGASIRVVSANDHVHARRSAHYEGLALDLHASAPDELADAMRRAGYRVLWRVPGHYNHLHVEDPAFQLRGQARALLPGDAGRQVVAAGLFVPPEERSAPALMQEDAASARVRAAGEQ